MSVGRVRRPQLCHLGAQVVDLVHQCADGRRQAPRRLRIHDDDGRRPTVPATRDHGALYRIVTTR